MLATVDVETIPAWLYFVGTAGILVLTAMDGVIILHYRSVQTGKLIPKSTVDMMVLQYETRIEETNTDAAARVAAIQGEMATRMDNFRADHAIRVTHAREDHEKQLAALVAVADGIRADRDAMLAGKQRDADDWRGAYHMAAENAKASEDRMDEVLETVRLTHAALNALRTIAGGTPELPPGGH